MARPLTFLFCILRMSFGMAFMDFTALFVKDWLPMAVHQLGCILSPLVFALVSLAGILFILAFRFTGVPVRIVCPP